MTRNRPGSGLKKRRLSPKAIISIPNRPMKSSNNSNKMKKILMVMTIFPVFAFSQEIAFLKYNGGGDWYANPTSLPNLAKFCNRAIGTNLKTKAATVEPGSPDLFSYPFVHMTGHGNVVFSDAEIQNLRNYLTSGGFLHADDNYG